MTRKPRRLGAEIFVNVEHDQCPGNEYCQKQIPDERHCIDWNRTDAIRNQERKPWKEQCQKQKPSFNNHRFKESGIHRFRSDKQFEPVRESLHPPGLCRAQPPYSLQARLSSEYKASVEIHPFRP